MQAILDHFEVLASEVLDADLQIAATAARHGLLLLTRDGVDFAGLSQALTVVDLDAAPS